MSPESSYTALVQAWDAEDIAITGKLRIVDVEVVEGGARIRVAAEAGGDGVDLSHANGVIYVAAGDTVTNLIERTVQGTTFSGDGKTATIQVPTTVGAFVKAVIGVGIMCGERN